MPNVLIFTASYGGGHREAARALTAAFALRRENWQTATADFVELVSPTFNRVSRYTYVKSVRNTPSLYGCLYRMTNHLRFETLMERQMVNFALPKILDFLSRHNPDVIIDTYHLAAGVLSYMKKRGLLRIPLVTVITDNAVHSHWINPSTDLYLVGSRKVQQELADLGVSQGKIAVTGIPIHPKFSSLPPRSVLIRKLGLNPHLPVLLVMTGAEGMLRGIPSLCRVLDDFPLPLQVLVVTGRDQGLYRCLRSLRFRQNFQIYGFVDNIQELMAVADLLITKAGGLTISEALAAGLPMLIYRPIPGQETENTRYLMEEGAALPVYDLGELRARLHLVLGQHHFLDSLRRRARLAGHPEAAAAAANQVAALLAGRRGSRNLTEAG